MEKILSPKEKYDLITDRLQEILGTNELQEILKNASPSIYFGTSTTGKPHLAYLIPLLKIADFIKAGCQVKILFADLHAMLDNLKTTPELLEYRCQYYEKIIKSVLRRLNINLDNLVFVRGTSFQLSPKYTMDLYRLTTITNLHTAQKAGAEVVKSSENPKMGGLLYPLLQALDEEYLDTAVQIGGIDQRKIFTLAQEILPQIGYKKRIHLMNPMLTAIDAQPPSNTEQNIADTKMSSSNTNSKIDFLDSRNEIKKKINRAYCLEGDISFNPLMELARMVIYPLLKNQNIASFKINRNEKYGGVLEYAKYADLELDFVEKRLHPQDLKIGIIDAINDFLDPIRQEFSSREMQQLIRKAYP